jgi:hypothetical protein
MSPQQPAVPHHDITVAGMQLQRLSSAAHGPVNEAQRQPSIQMASPSVTEEERQKIREEAEFMAELKAAAAFQLQELQWQQELQKMHDETRRLDSELQMVKSATFQMSPSSYRY